VPAAPPLELRQSWRLTEHNRIGPGHHQSLRYSHDPYATLHQSSSISNRRVNLERHPCWSSQYDRGQPYPWYTPDGGLHQWPVLGVDGEEWPGTGLDGRGRPYFLGAPAGCKRGGQQTLSGVVSYGRFCNRQLLAHRGAKSVRVFQFLKALNRRGALIPHRQAATLSSSELRTLEQNLPFREWVAAFLAFKSASRVSEVLQLTGRHLSQAGDLKLAINWLQTSKSGHDHPFAISNKTLVVFEPDRRKEWEFLSALPPHETLCPHLSGLKDPTAGLRYRMRKTGTKRLGAHSFKRTAATRILKLAAAGKADIALLPRLLKHKEAVPPIPDTSVRYADDPVAWATITRTGELTTLPTVSPQR